MKKETILLTIIFGLFTVVNLSGQNLNPTYAISVAGSADTFKGGYTFAYSTSGTPWNGSLISYGGFTNQYDCQISSEYYTGNHISFRTKNGDNNTWNPWHELATLEANNFIGNQSISGNLLIGNSTASNSKLEITGGGITTSLTNINTTLTQKINTANPAVSLGLGYLNSDTPFIQSYNSTSLTSNSLNLNPFGGNVGIGTTNPINKLDVNGTIHSKEVKVDMIGWSDFVFKKEYHLPTLEEVEKHIKEKGYLENIPSEEDVLKNGINLGEMNSKLLQKIEEMTLYMIDFKKEMNELKIKNEIQEEEIKKLKKINKI